MSARSFVSVRTAVAAITAFRTARNEEELHSPTPGQRQRSSPWSLVGLLSSDSRSKRPLIPRPTRFRLSSFLCRVVTLHAALIYVVPSFPPFAASPPLFFRTFFFASMPSTLVACRFFFISFPATVYNLVTIRLIYIRVQARWRFDFTASTFRRPFISTHARAFKTEEEYEKFLPHCTRGGKVISGFKCHSRRALSTI